MRFPSWECTGCLSVQSDDKMAADLRLSGCPSRPSKIITVGLSSGTRVLRCNAPQCHLSFERDAGSGILVDRQSCSSI